MIETHPSVHCWEDYPDYDTGKSYTCLLENEHEGDHEWTDDNDIQITFAGENTHD